MQDKDELYKKAGAVHGSICGGVVLGVRMALLGCRMINLNNPQALENRKKLMVVVETDRCATDGIQTVTGCTLGRRSLRVCDYGIMAATFLNLESKKAIRVSIHPQARNRATTLFPHARENKKQYAEAYKLLPDQELFVAEEVTIDSKEVSMPVHGGKRTECDECGEEVQAGHAAEREGKSLCRRCARLPLYYYVVSKLPVAGFQKNG